MRRVRTSSRSLLASLFFRLMEYRSKIGVIRMYRLFVASFVAVALLPLTPRPGLAVQDPPNFIIIFTDDQGCQDLGSFGSPTIKTPRIDKLARKGMKFTSFYAQTVCGPSRAALMTGSYPVRADFGHGWPTLWKLHSQEITIAEVLKDAGYATGMIGKWDLSGHKMVEEQLPLNQGFDYYFGSLGGNSGGRVQIVRNDEKQYVHSDMSSLTELFTDEAIQFIEDHRDERFFLYLAHAMPHVKIDATCRFKGKSKGGLYGDAVEEIDHHVGRIIKTLKKLQLTKDTIVVFTSDNGPWLHYRDMYLEEGTIGPDGRVIQGVSGFDAGSAGPLKAGKGAAWEGGFRVPFIAWGPGRVPAGRTTDAMMSTMDLLPTFAALAGARLPDDRVLDGVDQSALITGETDEGSRDTFFYYLNTRLQAVRKGSWKIFLPAEQPVHSYEKTGYPVEAAQLYNLDDDIGETTDVAAQNPWKMFELRLLVRQARLELGDGSRFPGSGRRVFDRTLFAAEGHPAPTDVPTLPGVGILILCAALGSTGSRRLVRGADGRSFATRDATD